MICNLGWPNIVRNLQAWFSNSLTSEDWWLKTIERFWASPGPLQLHQPVLMKLLMITFKTSHFLWGHLFLNLLYPVPNSKKSSFCQGFFSFYYPFLERDKVTSSYHLVEMKSPNCEFKGRLFFFFPSFFVNSLNMDLINMLNKQTQHIQLVWECGQEYI